MRIGRKIGVAAVAIGAAAAALTFGLTRTWGGTHSAHPSSVHVIAPLRLLGRQAGASVVPTLPDVAIHGMKLDRASVQSVGTFSGPNGARRNVFRARTTGGEGCIVEDSVTGTTPSGQPLHLTGGGCSSDVFLGHSIAWVQGGAGGPSAAAKKDLYIYGIAKPNVARVEVVSSDGTTSDVRINGNHAFYFQLPKTSLAQGVEPKTIRSFDVQGTQLDAMQLG
jgi:hypothetical protein